MQRIIAVSLAIMLAVGVPSSLAQSQGSLSGRMTDDSKKPYSDYSVQLRDAVTGQVLTTMPLDASGQFVFRDVPLGKRYLLELVRTSKKNVVCTSGPYAMTADQSAKTNVRLDCGRVPSSTWVLAAAAGTAGLIAIVTRSASQE
ncbi:MAG: carboxypeptidase-like regulatory domain-containing protein [Vicinamibacterales bacterium]